jgi:hypothetical protein
MSAREVACAWLGQTIPGWRVKPARRKASTAPAKLAASGEAQHFSYSRKQADELVKPSINAAGEEFFGVSLRAYLTFLAEQDSARHVTGEADLVRHDQHGATFRGEIAHDPAPGRERRRRYRITWW